MNSDETVVRGWLEDSVLLMTVSGCEIGYLNGGIYYPMFVIDVRQYDILSSWRSGAWTTYFNRLYLLQKDLKNLGLSSDIIIDLVMEAESKTDSFYEEE